MYRPKVHASMQSFVIMSLRPGISCKQVKSGRAVLTGKLDKAVIAVAAKQAHHQGNAGLLGSY